MSVTNYSFPMVQGEPCGLICVGPNRETALGAYVFYSRQQAAEICRRYRDGDRDQDRHMLDCIDNCVLPWKASTTPVYFEGSLATGLSEFLDKGSRVLKGELVNPRNFVWPRVVGAGNHHGIVITGVAWPSGDDEVHVFWDGPSLRRFLNELSWAREDVRVSLRRKSERLPIVSRKPLTLAHSLGSCLCLGMELVQR